MPLDIWHTMMRMRDQVLSRWSAMLKEGIALVGPASPAGARLTQHAVFFEFITAELPAVLARWDAVNEAGLPPATPSRCRMSQ